MPGKDSPLGEQGIISGMWNWERKMKLVNFPSQKGQISSSHDFTGSDRYAVISKMSFEARHKIVLYLLPCTVV